MRRYQKDDAGKACIKPPPIDVIDPTKKPEKEDDKKEDDKPGNTDCPDFMPLAVLSSAGKCQCFEDADSVVGGTACADPPAHGKGICKTTGGKGECAIKCDDK